MNNSFDKFHYNGSFTPIERFQDHSYFIKDQVEHTFDQRNHTNLIPPKKERHQHDSRTEDQVITNLNFSIQDLLTKISKATADFQEPPKITKPQSKTEYPAVFKLSNLSASTEGTSNQERSDQYIGRYEPHTQNIRKSQPHAEKGGLQKSVRNGFGQKQNSLYQTLPGTRNQSRNQLRSETYNHSKVTTRHIENSNNNFDFVPQHKFDFQTYEWNRNGLKNQTQLQKITEWEKNAVKQNLPFTEIKQRFHQSNQNAQKSQKWETNYEPKVDATHNYLHSQQSNEWTTNVGKSIELQHQNYFGSQNPYQIKKEEVSSAKYQHKLDDFENEWIKYELKMNELKKQSKTEKFQNFSFKNILHQDHEFDHLNNELITPQKKEFISQPQISINLEQNNDNWNHSARSSPNREIRGLLNQTQTSALGYNNNNLIRSKEYKKSIIILDEDDTPSSTTYQPIPVPADKKVNSLFDGKRIREVAASRIIESPDKEKYRKMQSPFNEILKTNDMHYNKVEQNSKTKINLHEPLADAPHIKINAVEKSQIVHNHFNGPKLTIQDFILGKQLGSGKFGDVYQAVHKSTGLLFAIKKIFKSTILEYNMIEQFTRELKIHYTLNYPNIIKLYTHFDDEYHVFLVMEYGQGGMLMEKVKNGEKFSSIIVEQMLRAVQYLHSKKIAHRDIKPQNIVLMFGDTAKLCDFGWSRIFDSDMKKTFCGTLDYVSPQMKDKGEYSLKIDVWSLGVLTFELLCGFAPFKDEITNWKKKGGNLNKAWNWNILYPPETSSVAESFMRNLLKENPEQRANIRFCLNHLFIRKYNEMNFNKEQEKVFRQVSMILKDD